MSHSSRSSIDSLLSNDPLKDSHHTSYIDSEASSPTTSLLGNLSEKLPFQITRRKRHHKHKPWRLPPISRMCCCMTTLFILGVFLLFGAGTLYTVKKIGVPPDGQSDPWYPSPRGGTVREWSESYRKAADLVRQMTVVEKVNITTGTGWMMGPCVGNTGPVERLKFPSLCLQDGPLGLRFADHITAFPAGITVGAGWNRSAMYYRGAAHGVEARWKGVNVILGPSMGPLGKLPAGGRDWEGFGADPYLQGVAAASTIQGIQGQGVVATAKHYVGNEQEHYRQSWEWGTPNAISSNIDDRTLHEYYAWPFADSVRAGVGSVMCSYNQVNNSYACQNSKLINGILKDEMGFQGFLQSDWLAQRSGVASALSGLDMSMPGDGLYWQNGKSLWGPELTKAVLNGTVPLERLDDMVLRIVAAWYQMDQDDPDHWPYGNKTLPNFSSWTDDEIGLLRPGSTDPTTGVVNRFVDVQADHHIIANQVATEGIVLVKNNESILPIVRDGFDMTKVPDRKLRVAIIGEDAFDNPKGPNACKDRACNEYTLAMGWGSGAVEFPYLISPAAALKKEFREGTVELFEHPSNQLNSALDAGVKKSDICFVFISSDAGEGFVAWDNVKGDRPDLKAQKGGDKLVEKVAKNCGNGGYGPVIVIFHTVGPVVMDAWVDHPNVKAILLPHLPGQESGNALASVVFGDVNPSGHLPYTIARREADYGPESTILTKTKSLVPQQNFTDRMYVDYRHFDAYNITPRFEFGFGLSFTNFHIFDIKMHSLITERKPFAAPRAPGEKPPLVDRRLPPASDALFPENLEPVKKYIYPYISSTEEAEPSATKYPYPDGYSVLQRPSPAGGAQGGNPDLFTPLALVTVQVENTGGVAGAAVVQLYVQFPANVTNSLGEQVDFPPRQLRGFEKVSLTTELNYETGEVKGERKKVAFELTRRDLSFWDVGDQNWRLPDGDFKIWVGQSSRNFNDQSVGVLPLPSKDGIAGSVGVGKAHGGPP